MGFVILLLFAAVGHIAMFYGKGIEGKFEIILLAGFFIFFILVYGLSKCVGGSNNNINPK